MLRSGGLSPTLHFAWVASHEACSRTTRPRPPSACPYDGAPLRSGATAILAAFLLLRVAAIAARALVLGGLTVAKIERIPKNRCDERRIRSAVEIGNDRCHTVARIPRVNGRGCMERGHRDRGTEFTFKRVDREADRLRAVGVERGVPRCRNLPETQKGGTRRRSEHLRTPRHEAPRGLR
jgi:hypothetical protein